MDTEGHSFIESCRMGVEQIKEWLSLAIPVGLIALLILNIKGIINGFKGDDGKWSVSEISKLIIVIIIIYIVSKDANRTHEWRYFSDPVYFAFILGLFALAELKEIVKLIYQIFSGKTKDNEQTNHS